MIYGVLCLLCNLLNIVGIMLECFIENNKWFEFIKNLFNLVKIFIIIVIVNIVRLIKLNVFWVIVFVSYKLLFKFVVCVFS